MKGIALLQGSGSAPHAGFWTLLRGFFHISLYKGITREPGRSRVWVEGQDFETEFFTSEEDLEDYIRSFRH